MVEARIREIPESDSQELWERIKIPLLAYLEEQDSRAGEYMDGKGEVEFLGIAGCFDHDGQHASLTMQVYLEKE